MKPKILLWTVQINELQVKVLEAGIGKSEGVLSVPGLDCVSGLDIVCRESGGKTDFSDLLEDMSAVQRRQQMYLDHLNVD